MSENALPPGAKKTVEGENVTDAFAGVRVADNCTLPLNPLTLIMARVADEVCEQPQLDGGLVMTATVERVKSAEPFTIMLRVMEWEEDPLVPVTVTVNVPVRLLGTVIVSVELPGEGGMDTLDGLRLAVGPVRDMDADSVIAPWNPDRLWTFIVEVPDDPAGMLRKAGLAERV